MTTPHRVIQATPGPPFDSVQGRRRPIGAIGGLVGRDDPAAQARLVSALGPGAHVFAGDVTLAVDHDACWLDERPVTDWLGVLNAGRLGEVEGAFALAWRGAEGACTLARDGLGERTLYYAALGEGLLFASTLRALLATGLVERALHLPAVATYLAYAYLPGRETLVRGVSELLPGEVLRFEAGRLTSSRLWSLPAEGEPAGDEAHMRLALRACLEQAVRRRLPVGEPVGAFLSGGLDSSLVVALACRMHDAPVETYSVSFGAGHANELPFSSLVADHCRTRHRIVELSPAVVLHHLDDSIGLLGDPIGDPLTVPNALLFREAAQDVGIVLNGEGGDPSFGGPKNLPMLLSELYGDGEPHARARSYLRAHLKCYDDMTAMLSGPMKEVLAADPLEERLSPLLGDGRWQGFVTRLQALNVMWKGAHHILPKVDAESRPFGVLPRSPLFDRRIVELAFAMPPQWKLHGPVEKYLLKEAVRDLLPPAIVDRPKSGMLVPVESWFQGPLLPEARARLLDGLAPYGLFERGYLERLLAGRLGGLRPRHGAKIWLLVTLESWLRSVLGKANGAG